MDITFVLGLLLLFLIFLISALPLYLAVKLLGGKTSLLKAAIIMLIAGLIVVVIRLIFPLWGAWIAFFLLIWIYHEYFRLKWWKACLVWLVHLIIILIFGLLLSILQSLGLIFIF